MQQILPLIKDEFSWMFAIRYHIIVMGFIWKVDNPFQYFEFSNSYTINSALEEIGEQHL